MKTFKEYLLEMPQVYHGGVVYQADAKFIPVSRRNANDYQLLGVVDNFAFLLNEAGTAGFVFLAADLTDDSKQHIIPAMKLIFEDSPIPGLKMVHGLRIRKDYAKMNIATTFYMLYVEHVGGIVSDSEHLEGGYRLWKSFLNKAKAGHIKVSLYDVTQKSETPVSSETSEDDVWKTDKSGQNILLIMRK